MERTDFAYFVEGPRIIEDLKVPHPIEQETQYEIAKTVKLAKIEGVAVAMANLMVPVRRVHDKAGDTLRVVGTEARHDDASVKGPVRGHAKGHEGVVIGRIKDGMSVHGSERRSIHAQGLCPCGMEEEGRWQPCSGVRAAGWLGEG